MSFGFQAFQYVHTHGMTFWEWYSSLNTKFTYVLCISTTYSLKVISYTFLMCLHFYQCFYMTSSVKFSTVASHGTLKKFQTWEPFKFWVFQLGMLDLYCLHSIVFIIQKCYFSFLLWGFHSVIEPPQVRPPVCIKRKAYFCSCKGFPQHRIQLAAKQFFQDVSSSQLYEQLRPSFVPTVQPPSPSFALSCVLLHTPSLLFPPTPHIKRHHPYPKVPTTQYSVLPSMSPLRLSMTLQS